MRRCNQAGHFAATFKLLLPPETVWQGRCPLTAIQILALDLGRRLVSTNFLWHCLAMPTNYPRELPPQTLPRGNNRRGDCVNIHMLKAGEECSRVLISSALAIRTALRT